MFDYPCLGDSLSVCLGCDENVLSLPNFSAGRVYKASPLSGLVQLVFFFTFYPIHLIHLYSGKTFRDLFVFRGLL